MLKFKVIPGVVPSRDADCNYEVIAREALFVRSADFHATDLFMGERCRRNCGLSHVRTTSFQLLFFLTDMTLGI